MNRIRTAALALLGCLAALSSVPAKADVFIANPTNTYGFPNLSGSLTGGNQTQYIGETFTAPINGRLTDFQFTLNSSSLTSLYGVVYAWNGSTPGAEIWRSPTIAGTAGLVDFKPIGANVTAGQTYVAFLSTYGLTDNSGLATVGTCNRFATCPNTDSIQGLGALIYGNVYPYSGVSFNGTPNNYADATFSATFATAAPEPATWAMMILGLLGIGALSRRRRRTALAT